MVKKIILFIVLLVIVGVVAWYVTGQREPIDSNGISPTQVIASVNGVDILGADLTTSISQITATAQIQGIDTTDPNVQADIQSQAVDMLINTKVLEQEAAERGLVVTEQDVTDRIEALVEEIGSEEALRERMLALGIDQETLEKDVKSELLIQGLLDQVFAEAAIEVTEEEVLTLYEATTGGADTAPDIEELRPQIEAQILAQEEQAVIDEFITELRTEAEIEVAE